MTVPDAARPIVHAEFSAAGALTSLKAGDLSLIQYPASAVEAGPQQVWLRLRTASAIAAHPLTGPASGGEIARPEEGGDGGVVLTGRLGDVAWTLWWEQPDAGVFGWTLRVAHEGAEPVEVDAVWTFDAALTEFEALRRNEFYVSQYLDVTPLADGDGLVMAVRQNMPGDAHPWLGLTATLPVAAWSTDALQLCTDAPGTGLRLDADLPSERLQHEHTLIGLQTEALTLAPGASETIGFRGVALADHPQRSGEADAAMVREVVAGAGFATQPPDCGTASPVATTIFSPVRWAHGEELSDDEFRAMAREATLELGPHGRPWAALDRDRYLVAAAKERAVLRPHGHIQRVSAGPGPFDVTAASTAWLAGTFASQVTLGHSCADPLVSVRRSYLGLTRAEGVRVFVRDGESWQLLGVPSAWETAGETCTWWYRWHGRLLVVVTALSLAELTVTVRVTEGVPVDLMLVSAERAADVTVTELGAAELVYRLALDATGAGTGEEAWRTPTLASEDEGVRRLDRMLGWLTANALVHYQAPRGLEQFTGGAWGTRDVCQGPVGLFVATGRWDVQREVLLATFAAQQDNGDWPQWFQYLADHAGPGYRESHGDVVYWPLLALGEYLSATDDRGILDAAVGWVGESELRDASSLSEHVLAAVDHLTAQRSADPRLPAYGHGDWNDALQPASPELAASLVSSWTATLEIQALRALAEGLRGVASADAGSVGESALADRVAGIASDTETALRERLIVDGELCGYAVVSEAGVEPLVHPADTRTGLHHGSLQMIHALADELLTPDEAREHLAVIDAHLDGPTGIYLFDRPVEYHGGETRTFLRAEAASFWGREIGLMYTHAHIRWVEALLRLGLAERAWAALQLVLPDGLRAAVPGAMPTQSNCYHSSVDALFADRYAAQERAQELFDAGMAFAGGWRVYSSGSGLVLRLVTEGFLGLRVSARGLVVDPVLPASLDGLVATVPLGDATVARAEATAGSGVRLARVSYAVTGQGCGVTRVTVNGVAVTGERVQRRYRAGGVAIPWDALGEGDVELEISVG